jgi:hypothetical protein
MCSLKPVPVTNYVYEGFTQNFCTLILLDVRRKPHSPPNIYDVYLIFRGFEDHYHFEPCIATGVVLTCDLLSLEGYNSLALKLARNGILTIEAHRKLRVKVTFANDTGFSATIFAPENCVMPFFREVTPKPPEATSADAINSIS